MQGKTSRFCLKRGRRTGSSSHSCLLITTHVLWYAHTQAQPLVEEGMAVAVRWLAIFLCSQEAKGKQKEGLGYVSINAWGLERLSG